MNPELEQLIAQARAALARGATAAEVDATFNKISQGRYPTFRSVLQASGQAESAAADAQSLKKQSRALDHGAISDFLRMGAQGASLGFGDELAGVGAALVPGGQNYTQARDASRERVAALRDPANGAAGASLLAEIAGGVATAPFIGGATVAKPATLLGKVAAGSATGAGLGGLFGAGESNAPTIGGRLKDAVAPAAAGAVMGGALPVAENAIGKLPLLLRSQNKRVAGELESAVGLSTDINSARKAADAEVTRVRNSLYKPLEQKIGQIGGQAPNPAEQEVLDILNSPDVLRFAPKSVAEKPMNGPWKFKRAWSYADLQGKGMLLDKLRRAAKTDIGLETRLQDLESALSNAYPEHAQANQQYAVAAGVRRALEQGVQNASKPAALVASKLEQMAPEQATAFRTGQLYDITRRLNARDKDAVQLLRTYLDAGEETKAQLRNLFDSDEKYNKFLDVLNKEDKVAKVQASLKNLGKYGGGALVGYPLIRYLFGGHESAP